MELKEIKVKKWMIILDIVIIILSTLIILFCVGNAFYSRINKRVELVHVDKKVLVKKIVTKEMIIVDQSDINEIRLYKNVDGIVVNKNNERAIFYKLKTENICKIEVVGRHTFWFHTLPNITRVFNCTRGE